MLLEAVEESLAEVLAPEAGEVAVAGQTNVRRSEQYIVDETVPDLKFRLKQKRNCAYVMQLTTDCIDTLYALAGANGLYTRGPMERIFRDQHAAGSHINFSIDAHTTGWGLVALGGEFKSPTL